MLGCLGLRIKPKCIPCLIDVRSREAMRALGSSEKAFNLCIKVVREILRLLDETRQTTRIATELYRIVLKTVGSDPYKADKEEANRIALAILPRAESLLNRLEDRFERFRMAVRFSLVGNAIDPGVSGYKFNLSELERAVQTVKLQVDDTAAAFRLIGNGSEVLYLCDNAGEIVFDRLLVRELRRIGAHVTVAVRSEPYQNDATLEDAEASGMAEEADGLMAC
ncbi:TPA: DUF89 family protein, partial [Candidatus Bathyarchaeota archaeon]|nr:DUF89 family protein [Candidatus Bathyarchaeota archaeon]